MGNGDKLNVNTAKAAPKRKTLPKLGGRNNATYVGQTFLSPGTKLPHCPYSKKTEAAVTTPSTTHSVSREAQHSIVKAMLALERGKRNDSVASIAEEFGVHRAYPSTLMSKIRKKGSVSPGKRTGRPLAYGPEFEDIIVESIK